jgi:hypothetical protein
MIEIDCIGPADAEIPFPDVGRAVLNGTNAFAKCKQCLNLESFPQAAICGRGGSEMVNFIQTHIS